MEGKRLIGTIFVCLLILFKIFKSLNKTDPIFVNGSQNVTGGSEQYEKLSTPFFIARNHF